MAQKKGPQGKRGTRGHLHGLDRLMLASNEYDRASLAAAAGVSEGTVSRWRLLQVDPYLHHAILLADAFGVTLDELAGRTPPSGQEAPDLAGALEPPTHSPQEPGKGKKKTLAKPPKSA